MTTDSKCIFCKISSGDMPSEMLHEDEEIAIFKDIKPAAKHHYLAIPKTHVRSAKYLTTDEKSLIEKLVAEGKRILQENGGNVDDLRLGFHWPPFNSVSHLHLHVISPASEMSLLQSIIFKPNSWWFATADYVLDNLPPPSKL